MKEFLGRVRFRAARFRTSIVKRVPFILPSRGPLARLDDRMRYLAYLIGRDPLTIYVPTGPRRPMMPVAALSRRLAGQRATFLLPAFWSLESRSPVAAIARDIVWHSQRFPEHRVIFLCNTEKEHRMISDTGAEALFANHNLMVPEQTFRPLPDVPVEFDAVYNARMSDTKRHHLAADIERVINITYSIGEWSRKAERAFVAGILTRAPFHAFANPIVDGLPVRIPREEVNIAYNRAAVGLCLSQVEGAMFSSMEYMLAGLPVVSTPSKGGRDVFFDPDYCTIVEPDPRAVRRAVDALRGRNIPREEIRARTLEKVVPQRRALMERLAGLFAQAGPDDWPLAGVHQKLTWEPVRYWRNEFRR